MKQIENYYITGDITNLGLKVSFGKHIIFMDDVNLNTTVIDIKQKPDGDSISGNTNLNSTTYPNISSISNHNLDYIGSIIEGIFNQVIFKIRNLTINVEKYGTRLLGKQIIINPSSIDIRCKIRHLEIITTLFGNLAIKLYKMTFNYQTNQEASLSHINMVSGKITLSSQETLPLLSNRGNGSTDLSFLTQLQCGFTQLLIYDTHLEVGIQLHQLQITKDLVSLKYIRLLDKLTLLLAVSEITFRQGRYLTLDNLSIDLNHRLINYLEKLVAILDILDNTYKPNIIHDTSTKTKINDQYTIIDDYVSSIENSKSSNLTGTSKLDNYVIKNNIDLSNITSQADEDYITSKCKSDNAENENDDLNVNIIKPMMVYKCKHIKLFIYDNDDKKCSYFHWQQIKYIKLTTSWNFTIKNFKIYDLTSNLWKNILYKIGTDTILTINANNGNNGNGWHLVNKHNVGQHIKNHYYLSIKLAKLAINLDELFIKKIHPVTERLNKSMFQISNYFSGDPVFILECMVSNINTTLSYKPRGLNLGNIIQGNTQELLRLGTIRDMELHFKNFIIHNKFGAGDLCKEIIVCLENELIKQGSLIISHVGILKQLFSPGLRATQVLSMNGSVVEKIQKYATHVSSDALELATRTSISIENVIDGLLGKEVTCSKLKSRKLLDTVDLNIVVRGITMTLLKIQSVVDPKQRARNKMRYGN